MALVNSTASTLDTGHGHTPCERDSEGGLWFAVLQAADRGAGDQRAAGGGEPAPPADRPDARREAAHPGGSGGLGGRAGRASGGAGAAEGLLPAARGRTPAAGAGALCVALGWRLWLRLRLWLP